MERIVRISEITIQNFKNVANGYVSMQSIDKSNASILGLYGQNGSGKTTLIDALQLLKYALCGNKIPKQYVDCISIDAEKANFKFGFDVSINERNFQVKYEFSLSKVVNQDDNSEYGGKEEHYKILLDNEKLYTTYNGEGRITRISPLIDASSKSLFTPKNKYELLVGKSEGVNNELYLAKYMTANDSRSFIFSKELLSKIRDNKSKSNSIDFKVYFAIIKALVDYGHIELFIINTANTGLISLNAQPLSFKYKEEKRGSYGMITLPLNDSIEIPDEEFGLIEKVIDNMNIVLQQLIPGLTIRISELGVVQHKDRTVWKRIQLLSCKNCKEIPLSYESDGIKKIISVLQLLIVVYNEPSITVAIDELDSGIFEYLLGEMLRILSAKGKGQLIFTSHNLRPLETIDKRFIAFTTTNKDNRYIRLSNVKSTNNLRDFYYRDIVLGEQSEEVYSFTNNFEIAMAFKEAGVHRGS